MMRFADRFRSAFRAGAATVGVAFLGFAVLGVASTAHGAQAQSDVDTAHRAEATVVAQGSDSGSTATDCGSIDVAAFQWPAAELVSHILSRALSVGYGCATRIVSASPPRAVSALAAPNGPALIVPGLTTEDLAAVAGDETAIRHGPPLFGDDARVGWFAPNWFLALNPDIRTLEDLALSERAFRTVGRNNRPQLFVCPASWPCHAENLALVDELGLASVFDIVTPASGDALQQSIRTAFETRSPWVGYAWTPSAIVAENLMTPLEIGYVLLCDGLERQSANCRPPFESSQTVAAYTVGLEKRWPRVATFLDRFALSSDAVSASLAWRVANNADLDQTTEHFFAVYPKMWDGWLDAEARLRFRSVVETTEDPTSKNNGTRLNSN